MQSRLLWFSPSSFEPKAPKFWRLGPDELPKLCPLGSGTSNGLAAGISRKTRGSREHGRRVTYKERRKRKGRAKGKGKDAGHVCAAAKTKLRGQSS